jgi:hypothetical protein
LLVTHNVEVANKPSEGNVLTTFGLRLPGLVLGLILDKDKVLVGVLVRAVDNSEGLVGHGGVWSIYQMGVVRLNVRWMSWMDAMMMMERRVMDEPWPYIGVVNQPPTHSLTRL